MSEEKCECEDTNYGTLVCLDCREELMTEQMIPLDDAVEVLAKHICVADATYIDIEGMWNMETEEQKQQYRDAAKKELGK